MKKGIYLMNAHSPEERFYYISAETMQALKSETDKPLPNYLPELVRIKFTSPAS